MEPRVIFVPEDVAEDLIESGSANLFRKNRDLFSGSAIEIAIDVVNTGAAAVSIAAGARASWNVARAILNRIRRSPDANSVVVTIRTRNGDRKLVIAPQEEDAEAVLSAFVNETLNPGGQT